MPIQVLCIGDVVGKPGRSVITEKLQEFVEQRQVDFVVCNAENAADGSGLNPAMFEKLLSDGVDVVTMGDHVYRRREILPLLQNSDRIVRPANLALGATGRRWTVVTSKSGQHSVGVTCLLGQMYMGCNDSPWQAAPRALAEMPSHARIRVVDFHAEATSEKIAMGYHLDGKCSIVFGTHTHVPTADARILPGGTAHISDVGMTGPYDSVLGRDKQRVLSYLNTTMPTRFDVATRDVRLCGVLVSVDPSSGKALAVERVEIRGSDVENTQADSDPRRRRGERV